VPCLAKLTKLKSIIDILRIMCYNVYKYHNRHSVMTKASKSNTMTIRLDLKELKRLDKLAKSTQRSRSFLAAEAIKDYIELNEWQINEIKMALREADSNEFATDKEVDKILKKWAK